MKVYKAKFIGRHVGAIGAFVRFSATVKAENEEQARMKLYEEYEHIQQLDLTEIDPTYTGPLYAYRKAD